MNDNEPPLTMWDYVLELAKIAVVAWAAAAIIAGAVQLLNGGWI